MAVHALLPILVLAAFQAQSDQGWPGKGDPVYVAARFVDLEKSSADVGVPGYIFKRSTAMDFKSRLGTPWVFLVGFSVVALAQSTALTNNDIIKMVRADLSEAVVLTTIDSARAIDFDVTPAGLIDLKNAGIPETIIQAMQARARAQTATASGDTASPERSDRLADSKDPQDILRKFKTLYVDASKASFFGNDQMKAELRKAKGFDALGVTLVDDPGLADVVLHVGYTFAWDYPFSLTHQNTTVVLLSGKGEGPFSGPAGAKSVAQEFTKLLKAHRTSPVPARKVKTQS